MNPLLPLAVLLAASFLWGLAWLPLKALERLGLSGVALTFIACGAAAALLIPHLVRERASWRAEKRWLLMIALLGGVTAAGLLIAGRPSGGGRVQVPMGPAIITGALLTLWL